MITYKKDEVIMKTLTLQKNINKGPNSSNKHIKELCFQVPFLVINTSGGVGKYKFNKIGYEKDMDWLRENITVNDLPASVRLDWAKKLAHWPQKHADEMEKKGWPAKAILNATLDAAEEVGYKWPVRYVVK